MALTEVLDLDIRAAQAAISRIEAELNRLSQPVNVPVNVAGEGQLADVRRELGLSEDAADDLNRELSQTDDELRAIGPGARRAGDDLERAGRRGTTAFSSLGTSVLGFAAALGAVQGLRELGQFFAGAITAASELEQSVGGVQAVFGGLSEEVLEFGRTADQAVGLTANQFNSLASVLGSQLQTFGFSAADAADETQRLVVLAADLAATFGGPASQAVEAISSLLRREANPIEQYAVAITQAMVSAKALELGLAATTSEISLQDDAIARLALLTEQTANAQGQFARESETTAGQLERMRADFGNVRAEIGEALIPAFNDLLKLVPPLVDALQGTLVPALAGLTSSIDDVDTAGFVTSIATLPGSISQVASQFGSASQAFGNAFQTLAAIGTLDVGGIGTQFAQLGDDIANFREAGIANTAVQNLIETLAGGVEPVTALEAVLATLGENVESMTLEGFEVLANQLVDMATAAGASAPELAALAAVITEFGESRGFSVAGVEILADLLNGPLAASALAQTGENFLLNANAIESVGGAAEGATGPLGEVADDFGVLANESQRAADNLRAAGDALLALTNPAFAALDAQSNLTAAQVDLAEAVEEFGRGSPEAIQAALDLAEAEIRLSDAAADLPDGLADAQAAILDTIDDGEVLDTTLQGVRDRFDELDGATAEMTLDLLLRQFGSTTGGAFGVGPAFEANDRPDTPDVRNGFVITQNFLTEPGPNVETARAAQQLDALIGGT